MNDKKFIKTKIRNSLKKMLGVSDLCGNPFRRLEVLSTMISGILMASSCRINDMARCNCDSKQQASKEKQISRWLDSKHTSYRAHFLPYVSSLLKHLSTSGELAFSIDGSTASSSQQRENIPAIEIC